MSCRWDTGVGELCGKCRRCCPTTFYLVTTWGHYPLGVYSTEDKAKACIAEEQEKRRKVKGMPPGEYRIVLLVLDE